MKIKLYLLMFLLLIVYGKLLAQTPDTVWISTYNGPAMAMMVLMIVW